MRKLCCVLDPATICEDCNEEICRWCIRIWNANYVANRSKQRGIKWLCTSCYKVRAAGEPDETYV